MPSVFACDEEIFLEPPSDEELSLRAEDDLTVKEALRIVIAAVTECVQLLRRQSGRDPVNRPLVIPLAAYRLRRSRDDIFPGIFAEASWDILLYLYECHRIGRLVSVTAACSASAVPATTALRHIGYLVDEGLITRTQSADDARVHHLDLTSEAAAKMDSWIASAVKIIRFPDKRAI